MKRPLAILAISFSLVTSSAIGEEQDVVWNQDVLRLFSIEERDEALRQILLAANYPDQPRYKEDGEHITRVKEVVLCAQLSGLPLVTVFAGNKWEPEDVAPRSGHFIVIRSDGMVLPFYKGAISLHGHFRDFNGDGVVDYLSAWGWKAKEGMFTGLHLVPIAEPFEAALVVYWPQDQLDWKLHRPDLRCLPTIQLGTTDSGEFKPVAEYKWSKEDNQWQGPQRSLEAGFVRCDGDPNELALGLLANQAGRTPEPVAVQEAQAPPVGLSQSTTDQQLPNLVAWQMIERGTSYDTVLARLGEPLNHESAIRELEQFGGTAVLEYGSPLKQSPLWPNPPSFKVWIRGSSMTVLSKEWPYGPNVDVSELPAVPELILPSAEAHFHHYPRYIDVRWFPAAAEGNVSYEVEHAILMGIGKWRSDVHKTAECYYVAMHGGANKGRIRVRSVDGDKRSQWSEWRNFDFDR
ncbi:hypothetical protein [Aeoliella sp.]|uniref:hypothetical protein n=1 Tax=Aeoliella sp. TaxID=2795800 RepID=UPI003CCBFE40